MLTDFNFEEPVFLWEKDWFYTIEQSILQTLCFDVNLVTPVELILDLGAALVDSEHLSKDTTLIYLNKAIDFSYMILTGKIFQLICSDVNTYALSSLEIALASLAAVFDNEESEK